MNDETIKPRVPLFTERPLPKDYNLYIYGEGDEEDSFGKALKRYVKELDLTGKQLETLTGISKSSFYGYYKDKKTISYDYLILLCVALRLHTFRQEYLFSFVPAEIKISDDRYIIIRSYLINCPYVEECMLDAMNEELKANGYEPILPKKRADSDG